MLRLSHVTMAAFAAGILAAPAAAQDRRVIVGSRNDDRQSKDAFEWSGEIARGQRLYIYNLNGGIKVEESNSRKVEVVAREYWRRGRPEDVTFMAKRVRSDRDIVVCAIWSGTDADCNEDGYHSRSRQDHGNRSNDIQVEFTIKLPAGAHVTAHTVNGDVEVAGVSGDVDVAAVNGRIDAETTDGLIEAETTNGAIRARMSPAPTRNTSFRTVSGSITLSLPDNTNADIDARTVNGTITSDFPITVGGQAGGGFSSRRLRGVLGRGGPHLTLETVNGGIRIEKR